MLTPYINLYHLYHVHVTSISISLYQQIYVANLVVVVVIVVVESSSSAIAWCAGECDALPLLNESSWIQTQRQRARLSEQLTMLNVKIDKCLATTRACVGCFGWRIGFSCLVKQGKMARFAKVVRSKNLSWKERAERGLYWSLLMSCPIVPVMLGDARLASEMADEMLKRGIYVTWLNVVRIYEISSGTAHWRGQSDF